MDNSNYASTKPAALDKAYGSLSQFNSAGLNTGNQIIADHVRKNREAFILAVRQEIESLQTRNI